jgi:hypothetical protein
VLAIATAQQTTYRLPRGLAQQIPERDVDATDGVRDRATAALPKSVLMQGLANALRLERGLPEQQRLQQL